MKSLLLALLGIGVAAAQVIQQGRGGDANQIVISSAPSGSDPSIVAGGPNAGANVNLALAAKGSGQLKMNSTLLMPDGSTWSNTGPSGGSIPLLSGANVWTGQQSVTPKTLTIATSTFTPDGSSNNYAMTLVHASCPCTLANPSATPVPGTGGQIVVIQSSSGSDTIGTWGSQYEASGGTSGITLSAGANAVDILSYYVRDATHIELSLLTNFSH